MRTHEKQVDASWGFVVERILGGMTIVLPFFGKASAGDVFKRINPQPLLENFFSLMEF